MKIDVHLWNDFEDEMIKVHQLNNIVRYNTRNKINPESVASHSFFAAYFVLSICRRFKIPDKIKLLALESAVIHDVPEVFINDITYDCKQLVPGIEDLLEPYERSIISQISSDAAHILFDKHLNLEECLAHSIVEWADILSVKQYALSEVELGNKPFQEILEGTEERLRVAELNFHNLYFVYRDTVLMKGNNQYAKEQQS